MISFNISVTYTILGLIFIIFNKKIASFFYKLVLSYTKKLRINNMFIFRIDKSNKTVMIFLTKGITILLGLGIIFFSWY